MTSPQSRRDFLRLSASAAAAGIAMPWALGLNGIAEASNAAQTSDGYRALVCVFLYGGNDNYNTFVPNDEAGFTTYADLRGNLGKPFGSILPINPANGFAGDGTVGFAPELPRLHNLFTTNKLAIVNNLGSMLGRLEKPTWKADPSLIPPSLGSHNDQQSFWQSGVPEGANSGWGGRLGDVLNPANVQNGANPTFMSTSVFGNAVLMTGRETQQFQVSTEGPTAIQGGIFQHATSMTAGLNTILRTQSPGLFPSTYSAVSLRALESSGELGAALASVNTSNLDPLYGEPTPLVEQLKMVARLIVAGRDELKLKRQVFFVGMGGFDTHNDLVAVHPGLLRIVDNAMAGFYESTVELGVADSVTTFTGSDFGRTLSVNDDGSDHGWGSTHMVMGGSVRGGNSFGQVPTVALDGPNSIGRGRLLPTTSVDEYGATMARWMGAPPSAMASIFPNLGAFGNPETVDLGFMQP